MTDKVPRQIQLTADDLMGSWECFEGDGIHGWDSRQLVFSKHGDRMFVAIWLPFENGKPIEGLRLFGTFEFDCSPHDDRLRLLVKTKVGDLWDILPQKDGSFILKHPNSTAGATSFRRTDMPGDSATLTAPS